MLVLSSDLVATWISNIRIFQRVNTEAVSIGQGKTVMTKVFMLKSKGSSLLKT